MKKLDINNKINLYYWKNNLNEEVDFVIKEGIKIKQLIQVCYNINDYETKKREIKSLLKASKEDLLKGLPPKVVEGVLRVREGKVNINAGFDGEYGIISIFGDEEKQDKTEQQLSLF